MQPNASPAADIDQELAHCMLADAHRIRRKLNHRSRGAALAAQIEASKARCAQRAAALPKPDFDDSLPIAAKRHDIEAALREHQVIVVCGDTGSGKSTQLPKICVNLGRGVRGFIGHTQPRRLAARSVAARVAEELHTTLGGGVGYKVRFTEQIGRATFVKVLTDGMLLAEIAADRHLYGYDTLIIDEAHERSLNIDFLLGLVKRLLPQRPDLKVIVTSATIDPQRFADYFCGAPVIEVSGRTYPVEVRYRPTAKDDSDRPLQAAILRAVDELSAAGRRGDILVFLAGENDIRVTAQSLRKRNLADTEILPLYARLSAADQQRVFKPHPGRRIVLATNVAETSLTVPGIRYVIDTGLARVSRYSSARQIQRLPVEPVSQSSADQRAGRCGRTAPGICIRLYSEDDYRSRPQFTDPEVLRSSLAGVVLTMADRGLGTVDDFPFLDAPPAKHVNHGYRLLLELGAVDDQRRITPLGRRLARFPIDPRLARMLVAADRLGCLREVLTLAAALEGSDPREFPDAARAEAQERHRRFDVHGSDFLALLALWSEYRAQTEALSDRQLRRWCKDQFLSYARLREWRNVRRQLAQVAREMKLSRNSQPAAADLVHRAVLSGLIGNIARLDEKRAYTGTHQKRLFVHPGSSLFRKTPPWIMAAELVDTGRLYARVVAPIRPEWVETYARPLLRREYLEPVFDARTGRVMAFERATLFGLTVISRRRIHLGPLDPPRARAVLIREGLVGGRLRTGAGFLAHNRALLARLAEYEHKTRRTGLVIDDETMFEFYAARVPADLYSAARFERWRQAAETENPRLLYLEEADALRETAADLHLDRFPDVLEVSGNRLSLHYHFAPGHPNDGVTVTLPMALLNQIPAAPFTWPVPGLLHEKITALIKSLPKPIRRRLAPAPDFAARAVALLDAEDRALTEALADVLKRLAGVAIAADDWDLSKVPRHLITNFRVVDAAGDTVAYGRDLAALRATHRDASDTHFTRSAGADIERSGITRWDFGALPETVEIEREDLCITAYPALEDRGDSVALKVFPTQAQARAAMRAGLHRLLTLALPAQVKFAHKNLKRANELALLHHAAGAGQDLAGDILHAALERTAFDDGSDDIRDPESFARRVNRAKSGLLDAVNGLCAQLHEILTAHRDIRKALEGIPTDIAADVREQLAGLVFPGFVRATPARWLAEYPRYLAAVERRLERAARDPAKDRNKRARIAPYWRRYADAEAAGSGFDTYRWMLEEYRVSLFAQELGTALAVSPKRLDAAWRQALEDAA